MIRILFKAAFSQKEDKGKAQNWEAMILRNRGKKDAAYDETCDMNMVRTCQSLLFLLPLFGKDVGEKLWEFMGNFLYMMLRLMFKKTLGAI